MPSKNFYKTKLFEIGRITTLINQIESCISKNSVKVFRQVFTKLCGWVGSTGRTRLIIYTSGFLVCCKQFKIGAENYKSYSSGLIKQSTLYGVIRILWLPLKNLVKDLVRTCSLLIIQPVSFFVNYFSQLVVGYKLLVLRF